MDGKIDIKAMRKARGMSQEQVGILAGMSKSQVSRMENGTLGSPATYARVLDALGYRAVVSYQDVRADSLSDRERLLSLLKVYFSSNKEAFGIERLGLFGSFAHRTGPTGPFPLCDHPAAIGNGLPPPCGPDFGPCSSPRVFPGPLGTGGHLCLAKRIACCPC